MIGREYVVKKVAPRNKEEHISLADAILINLLSGPDQVQRYLQEHQSLSEGGNRPRTGTECQGTVGWERARYGGY